MHPDLTIAVARDRHVRRTAAVEARSGRPVPPDAVVRPPVVPTTDTPVPTARDPRRSRGWGRPLQPLPAVTPRGLRHAPHVPKSGT